MPDEIETAQPQSLTEPPLLLRFMAWSRFISLIAVLAALASALLMIWIGAQNTLKAFLIFVGKVAEASLAISPAEEATLQLLESLDNFLVGLTFLYFAYGIYALFIGLERYEKTPQWLRIKDIATLKKSLLEVLVVLLSVIFVKRMLETVKSGNIEWTVLVIPLSIIAIALSTRLMSKED